MTNNEEAIYVLKNAAFLSSGRDFEEVEEAVRLAISALESIDRITTRRDALLGHRLQPFSVYGEDVCRRCDEESTEPPKKNENRIEIRLPNSFRLVAERNPDAAFDRELNIGIVDDSGVWYQDLAIVRNAYEIDEMMNTVWKEDEFEILVYSNKDDEDYTHAFRVEMNRNGSI